MRRSSRAYVLKGQSNVPVKSFGQLFNLDVFGLDGRSQLLHFWVGAAAARALLEFVDFLDGLVVGLSVLVQRLLNALELCRLRLAPCLPVADDLKIVNTNIYYTNNWNCDF